jgi:2-polyprenyl-3-methyl-5-hydroxy-6-metoxy-1,4-benzoquinol methylase
MIRILVSSPIKADATSFYRGWGPLRHLAKTEEVQLIDATLPNFELSWDVVTQADLVFCQRPSTSNEVQLLEIARNCNVPTLIDYDDDYLSIPETNPRYNLYANPHRVEQIKRCISLADMIIVSTIGIKDSIIKKTGKSKDHIQVIPNGIDETIFDCAALPDKEEFLSRKVVLWRGGDTHTADMAPYLDAMAAAYNEFTDYKWAFMGHAPQEFLSRVDNSRIILFPFSDVMAYIHSILSLKPKVTIVPWENSEFNKSKSSCSWLETTLAGGVTIFPGWSTEAVPGMIGYINAESFYNILRHALQADIYNFVEESSKTLRRFTLESLNKVRYDAISDLVYDGRLKISIHNNRIENQHVTDELYYNICHRDGIIQDNDQYREINFKVADWLYQEFKPLRVIDFGCGPGALVERLCDLKVPQVVGLDINEHFHEYFKTRNPHYGNNYALADIFDLAPDGIFDLGVCIEVFQFNPMEKIEAFLSIMSGYFKRFYFSSSPYYSKEAINTRTHEDWIKIFERNGWKYENNPQKLVQHDHLFVSNKV